MSGTGYDLLNTIYSQDGRLFQIEYAQKAIDNAETVVGVVCSDGVILALEKIKQSPLLVKDANRRIFNIETHIGIAICGRIPDGMIVVHRAREEAEQYRNNFGVPISGTVLAERVANFVHAYTLYGAYRPFGATFFIASMDNGKPSLYKVENSGEMRGYFGCTDGKGKQVAKTELEKVERDESCQDALSKVARAVVKAHEEFKEKTYEFEASWICSFSNGEHKIIEAEIRDQLRKQAEDDLDEE